MQMNMSSATTTKPPRVICVACFQQIVEFVVLHIHLLNCKCVEVSMDMALIGSVQLPGGISTWDLKLTAFTPPLSGLSQLLLLLTIPQWLSHADSIIH